MIITIKTENVDDYYYEVFVVISGAITGFSENELMSTGLAGTYYQHILQSIETATFMEFLNVSKNIVETSNNEEEREQAIQKELVDVPEMKDIFNKLVKLWYQGTWEEAYVNDLSYKEGLVWKVFSAHPPGAKQPGYKSWSDKPVNSNV